MDDGVEEDIFEKERGTLKAIGEILPDGLLDDAWFAE